MSAPLSPEVEVKCTVNRELHEAWKRHFPFHGSIAWAVRATMKELIAQAGKNTDAETKVRDAVQEMLSVRR